MSVNKGSVRKAGIVIITILVIVVVNILILYKCGVFELYDLKKHIMRRLMRVQWSGSINQGIQ